MKAAEQLQRSMMCRLIAWWAVVFSFGYTQSASSQLVVTPPVMLVSTGYVGGPFSPSSVVYNLSNGGGTPLTWVAGYGPAWLSYTPSAGTLFVGASTPVTVSINSNANSLAGNTFYASRFIFSNTTDNAGTTNLSASILVKLPLTPPPAPVGLTATAVSSSEIDLSWYSNTIYEDGFTIERSIDAGGNPLFYSLIATVGSNILGAANTYQDKGLSQTTIYWYRVRAYNAAGNSPYSTEVFTATPCAPSNIVGIATQPVSHTICSEDSVTFSVVATGNPVAYQWRSNGTNLLDGGTVSGSTTPALTVTNAGSSCVDVPTAIPTGIAWGNVVAGQTYTYQATGCARINGATAVVDPDGHNYNSGSCGSGPYTTLTATSAFICPGLEAWSLVGKVASTCIQLGSSGTFVAPASGTLTLCLNDEIYIDNAGSWNVCVRGGDGSNSYDVIVTGTCGSQTSTVATLTIQSAPPFPNPLTAIAVSSNQVNLAWTSIGNPDGFTIQRALDNGGSPGIWSQIASLGSNITAYSDTGLTSDTTYWYQIQASNTCGQSSFSSPVNATPPSAPAAPSGLVATPVSGTEIDLTWTDNSTKEDGFNIERAPNNGGVPGTWAQITAVGANVTNYSDTGLAPNTTYWYRVRAFNIGGNSPYSPQTSAATKPISAPSGLGASGVASNQINVFWVDNSGNEDGFAVERAPDNAGVPGAWAQVGTVLSNVTAYSDIGLAPNTVYWYRVRAFNAGANSDYSNQASAKTLPLPPAAPSGLTATPLSGSQIGLSWTESSTNVTSSSIERAPDNSGSPGTWAQIATVASNITALVNSGLTTNTTYWYRVRSSNIGGFSPYSNLANATTLLNQTNSWISPVGGKWETGGSWSLGAPPSMYELAIAVTNINSKTVTIDATTASSYTNAMTISNLTVSAAAGQTNTLLVSTAGSATPLHVLRGMALSSGGVLDVENSSLQVDLLSKNAFTIDGTLQLQNGGRITLSREGQLIVGNVATGLMMISSGTVVGAGITVGNAAGSGGTLTISNGATVGISSLAIAQSANSTGAVWMTGGQLTTTNGGQPNVLYVGYGGVGQMTVSNSMVSPARAYVGALSGSRGTLTIAGGSVTLSSTLNVGSQSSAVGAVWVTGGLLSVTNGPTAIGVSGTGHFTTIGGSVQSLSMVVGQFPGSQGFLVVSGGTVAVSSSLVIGDCMVNAAGFVRVTSGGTLFVTNATHTAFIDLRSSLLIVDNGGTLVVDRLVMTNFCGTFVRNGGTVSIGTTTLDPTLSALNDGIPNGWKQQYGFDPLDPGVASKDTDGDGLTTLQEYLAGTDPTNARSVLRITAIVAAGADTRVYFTSVGGKYYSLERSDFMGGPWTDIVTNIPGNDGVQWAKDIGGATRASAYYRILLGQPSSPPPPDSDGDGITDAWSEKYFGHPTGLAADHSQASADADGDGMSNLQEFLAGTDPTNASSQFRITSAGRTGNDLMITWTMGSGKTNALQAVAGDATGGFNTNGFTDVFVVTNTIGTVTNYLDVGAATNVPARYYRARLVP